MVDETQLMPLRPCTIINRLLDFRQGDICKKYIVINNTHSFRGYSLRLSIPSDAFFHTGIAMEGRSMKTKFYLNCCFALAAMGSVFLCVVAAIGLVAVVNRVVVI